MSQVCPELELCVRRAVVNTLFKAIRECERHPENNEIQFKLHGHPENNEIHFKLHGYREALPVARARLRALEEVHYPHVRGC